MHLSAPPPDFIVPNREMFLLGHIEHLIFHSYFMDLFMSASDILVCVFISLSCALCVRACVLLCLFLDAILFARMSDLHRAVSHSVKLCTVV